MRPCSTTTRNDPNWARGAVGDDRPRPLAADWALGRRQPPRHSREGGNPVCTGNSDVIGSVESKWPPFLFRVFLMDSRLRGHDGSFATASKAGSRLAVLIGDHLSGFIQGKARL